MIAHLINIDTIKERGYTNYNVEDNIVATTIIRVQDTMLKPILGTSLFNRLIEGVNNSDLNANEETLLDDWITPWLIASVDYRIIKHLTYEIRSKTAGTTRDEHMNPLTESEMNSLSDDLFKDIDVYRLQLIGYLKENCDIYPEYNNPDCEIGDILPDSGAKRVRIRFC
jgi:hypothetical protein